MIKVVIWSSTLNLFEGQSASEINTKFCHKTAPHSLTKCDFPKLRVISIPAFQCQSRQINSLVEKNKKNKSKNKNKKQKQNKKQTKTHKKNK